MQTSDIIIDCLTFPIATGQEETRRDGIETIEAIREVKRRYPEVQTTLGLSNISFGLNPAARVVLNSVFLQRVRRGRPGLRDRARGQDPADGPDPRRAARGRARHGLRPAPARATTRCSSSWSCSRASPPPTPRPSARPSWPTLPVSERLQRRIIDGEGKGLERRPRPGAGRQAGAGDHQHRPAGGHEGRRRAVRLRPDAAAVRAAVRRGDEDRRSPTWSRTWRRPTPGARAPSCWPRSRATCTTSARTSSTSS